MENWLIIIVLSVLTISNLYYLYYFKTHSREKKGISELDNYYKLDAKIELQKYMAIGLISIGAWFGISKFSDLSLNFKRFDDLDRKYNQLSSNYEKLNSNYEELNNTHEKLLTSLQELSNYPITL